MLNEKDFEDMEKNIKDYNDKRDELIGKSRKVIKLSKQLIYAVHRGELDKEELIEDIEEKKKEVDKIAEHDVLMASEGSYRVAVQEYVEALLYFEYIKNSKIPSHEELDVKTKHYILGMCDLTGELVRKAVYLAGKGENEKVVEIKDLVDEIYGQMLKFEFRDNHTRKKVDSIKYDLKKLEDLVLDLKLK